MFTVATITEANAELTLRLRQQELAAEFAVFSLRTDDMQPVLNEVCRIAAKEWSARFPKCWSFCLRKTSS